MRLSRYVIVTLLTLIPFNSFGSEQRHVSIRCTTAGVVVGGDAKEVTARLVTQSGREIPGLAIERSGDRVSIILVVDAPVGSTIEVDVPESTDLRVEASNGGDVVVRDVRGELEIMNSNAGIVMERVAGTVLATTSNGPIEVSMIDVDPNLPMSFLTSNAAIDVTFPRSLSANLTMESDTGDLVYEFEMRPVSGELLENRVMRGGHLRSIVRGAIGRGGPEILMRTENASVTVRRGDR